MRRRLALAVAIATAVIGFGSVQAPASSPAPAALAKTCGSGYVHARLSWGEKCLRAGQFCKVGNKEYLRYGFYCPPTKHLKRR